MRTRITTIAFLLCAPACLLWVEPAMGQIANLSTSAISFGNVAVGATSSRNLSITNTGTTSLVITSIAGTGNFQSSNCASATITPNGSCTVSVSFSPPSTGSNTGSLTITDNASNSPQVVSLSGTGVPAVTFSPPSLMFPNQATGTASVAENISVINEQTVPLNITSVTTTGSFTATSCPATIAALTSCVISVTFTPSVLGTNTGTLVVTDSSNNSPQSVSLTGTGVQPVTFSQVGISFGNQVVNTTSSAKSLTLTNNQSTPLNISSITATADFTAGSCATPIPAYGTCAISVTFGPPTTGNVTGTLTVTDGASTSPQTASLSGTGVLSVSLSPTGLQFPSQFVGTTSPAKTVTLSNNQSTALSVTSVTTSGPFAASTCPSSIVPNGTCAISVTFTPSNAVNSSGTLTVVDSASSSPQTATLQGIGAALQLTSITVTPANPLSPAGTTRTFTATGNYNSGATANLTNSVVWASSATSVATVSSAGVATAVATGSTTISATSGTVSGSTSLTVTAPLLVSIAVTPASPSVTTGATQQFTATGTYTDGSTSNLTSSVTWSSSSSSASITSGGLATGVAAGSSTITAASGSIGGIATLTVTPAVTSIAITPVSPSVSAGSAQQLTATATFSGGSTQNVTNSATWSSSSSTIATLSAAGLATGVAQGTATVSATYGSVTGNDTITVTPAALVSIAVTPPNPSLTLSATQQFTATGTFTDGSTQNLTSTGVTWSAGGVVGGNATVGTIIAGLYTAPATVPSPAQVTVTATSTTNGTISGSSTLTVSQIAVTISPATAQVEATQTQQFTATVTGTSNTGVTWSAGGTVGGNTTVGTISTSGLYTAPASVPTPAQVTIAATSASNGVTSASATLTVVPLIGVTISPSTAQKLAFNSTEQFTATVTGTSNTAVTWSAGTIVGGNIIEGTINSSGLYTAPPTLPVPSQLNITATSVADPTKSASVEETVQPPTGVVVTVSPETVWVQTGGTQQYFTGVLGTSNLGVTWSAGGVVGGNATVGTISSSGLYTAPSTVPSPAQVTVTGTSVVDSAASGNGTVTVATTPFSATPLVDFAPGQLYFGEFPGMLYNGSNSPPPAQLAAGQAAGALVQPLDVNGNPSPTGEIVLISLGMSETYDDWCDGDQATNGPCTNFSFTGQAAASSSVNHTTLAIMDGADSGMSTWAWTCAFGNCPISGSISYPNNYDRVLNDILTPAGLTEAQVQVVWIEEANPDPTWRPSLPSSSADAYNFEYQLGLIVRTLMVRWPNVKQVFISSRIYAGYANTEESPEPSAYETGFGVKWFVNAQITQRETGVIDPLAGDLLTAAPFVDWGPYLWGNDSNNIPGSLALNWPPSDFTSDGTHPDPAGAKQVGAALLNFYLTSPETPWFPAPGK
jgi:hypothetical protein